MSLPLMSTIPLVRVLKSPVKRQLEDLIEDYWFLQWWSIDNGFWVDILNCLFPPSWVVSLPVDVKWFFVIHVIANMNEVSLFIRVKTIQGLTQSTRLKGSVSGFDKYPISCMELLPVVETLVASSASRPCPAAQIFFIYQLKTSHFIFYKNIYHVTLRKTAAETTCHRLLFWL